MARPKKERTERRDEQVNIRFTAAEAAFLDQQARAAGLSVSDYARRRILGHRVNAAVPAISAELVRELNAAGSNLNQITRYLHAGRPLSADAERIFGKLERVIDAVLRVHGS